MIRRWTIGAEPVAGADVEVALREYVAEVGRRVLGRPATEAEIAAVLARDPHGDLRPPRGALLVARGAAGGLLGCAGVRLLRALPGSAELKRLYVRPERRGAGLGRDLLLAAERTSRRLGASRIVLDTRAVLVEARALYAAHGYREIEPYDDQVDAEHWYAKQLC
ncbi:GNAT family N-acetyltransferase [Saccharopolyspora sp. MS10]|uniref:GNAT family N-acetyltransferase n=1 Tax=Saccharopolyspora sp. MS10 TaxID=3385973 RepID=UPI0039A19044